MKSLNWWQRVKFLFTSLLYMQDFIIPQEAALLRCCVKFSDKCWGTPTKKCVLFMMCRITVLRVDLLGCIQPLIWVNLDSIKCLLVGIWLAYYISHFNEKHSDANTVCLDWVQMPLSWLMKAFDHTSTNWNLKRKRLFGLASAVPWIIYFPLFINLFEEKAYEVFKEE